jgi:hypothetical protein
MSPNGAHGPPRSGDCPAHFSEQLWARICRFVTGDGDIRSIFRGFDEPFGDAKSSGERTASRDIRTARRKMSVALELRGGAIGFPSPPTPLARDHPGTAAADPDASRPFAERDNAGPARHELRDRGSSFGSAGRPDVDFLDGLPVHSLRCNRLGPDRSSDRRTPEHDTDHTGRSEQTLRPRFLVSGDVSQAYKNGAPTFFLIREGGYRSSLTTHGFCDLWALIALRRVASLHARQPVDMWTTLRVAHIPTAQLQTKSSQAKYLKKCGPS